MAVRGQPRRASRDRTFVRSVLQENSCSMVRIASPLSRKCVKNTTVLRGYMRSIQIYRGFCGFLPWRYGRRRVCYFAASNSRSQVRHFLMRHPSHGCLCHLDLVADSLCHGSGLLKIPPLHICCATNHPGQRSVFAHSSRSRGKYHVSQSRAHVQTANYKRRIVSHIFPSTPTLASRLKWPRTPFIVHTACRP